MAARFVVSCPTQRWRVAGRSKKKERKEAVLHSWGFVTAGLGMARINESWTYVGEVRVGRAREEVRGGPSNAK